MNGFRKALVLLLVLAYAGQSLAALALPCATMSHAGAAGEMADMDACAHAGHPVPADSAAATTPPAGDCCDGGLCAASHCQTAAALPWSDPGNAGHPVAPFPRVAQAPAPFHHVDSRYRPPISR